MSPDWQLGCFASPIHQSLAWRTHDVDPLFLFASGEDLEGVGFAANHHLPKSECPFCSLFLAQVAFVSLLVIPTLLYDGRVGP